MKKRRGQGGAVEDQYGETQVSQDREFQGGQFSGKRQMGGGTAGSSRSDDMKFQRQVPKFLQQYSHLLGKGAQQNEDEPIRVGGSTDEVRVKDAPESDDDKDDDCEKDALKRAMEENPTLAKEFEHELNHRVVKAEASELKGRGNRAFSSNKYEEAERLFTQCIALNPNDEVFYSNRSAARCSLERYEEALEDAKQACVLKPYWSRGWARAAAACMAMHRFSHAREYYETAIKLSPEDTKLQAELQKAITKEHHMIQINKVVFVSQKRKRMEELRFENDILQGMLQRVTRGAIPDPDLTDQKAAVKTQKNLLSFKEDEE
uniref:Uncharacterized protein n=1 Tax=Polytomella parva TaxID=51329 RepID=A0A7S0YA99_9CHLO